MARARLAVLFGGASSEHEISLRSARSVIDAVDRERFEPVLVGISRDGVWHTGAITTPLADIVASGERVTDIRALAPDVVFPVLHGPHGEDGTIQGLLELAGVPYVGSGVLASALCMDKVAQKLLVAAAAPEVPLVPWLAVDGRRLDDAAYLAKTSADVASRLGMPCFVKPANLGSSVGVSKVEHPDALEAALRTAAAYDNTVVVERGVDAREIEIAVLGNGGPDTFVSQPGEIVLPKGVWYDYATKYLDDTATIAIPAAVSAEQVAAIRESGLLAYRAAGCSGLARIDFLVDRGTGTAYLNELNTMPGFTSISMYPKLMAHSGVGYVELVSRLCDLAIARHRERSRLKVEL